MRTRLAAAGGPALWRSLEEIAGTPEFVALLEREFPARASEWAEGDQPSRRQFLKLMAASLALAGLGTAGCTRQPKETILPYVRQPEQLIPGIPLRYATAMPHFGGFARGVLVESHEGRPTKIEGNPAHPANPLGATDVFMQASILDLYDPDRAQTVLRAGEGSSWESFLGELVPLLLTQHAKAGAGLRILTETVVSPTLGSQLEALLKTFPQARWHQWEPVGRDHVREGARMAFGDTLETHYHFEAAKVILSLDSDFLFGHPDSLRHARGFTDGRRVHLDSPDADPAGVSFNRLYVVESTPTITGSMADHRLPLAAREIEAFAGNLRDGLTAAGATASAGAPPHQEFLERILADLRAHRGASLVIAGERQPPAVHAFAHAMNAALGNVGTTVTYAASAEVRPESHTDSLRSLAADLRAGNVDLLLVLGGNPVYTAPADLGFADAFAKADRRVHLGPRYDETSLLCHWHLPEAHFLETWGDGRAFDGTVSIQQPLIEPLYPDARGAAQVLDYFLQAPVRTAYDLVRDHWRGQNAALDDIAFDRWWRRSVHDGFVAGSALPVVSPADPRPFNRPTTAAPPPPTPAVGALELCFAPDPTIWDGRFASNAWLQEIPKPLTKLTWDNAALISPKLAERLGLANEDVVELTVAECRVRAPVWVLPGQAENSVTIHLGYGRRATGSVGTGQGVDAYALRTAASLGFSAGLQIQKISGTHWPLAATQTHHGLHGREDEIFRSGTLVEFRARPALTEHAHEPGPADTLYPPDHTYPGHAWGMVIDLNTCIGCNACTVACQAENNIPVVGKGEVARQREMHWIRVDSYFGGQDLDQPQFGHQPVPCMHCENAPCEVVCPVEATLHSPEGLNEQVYNRCIGTRYCSNNCPYKVRRFNFLQWADNTTLQYKLQRNPDVTVRSRGVMEKCTFCVQRIQEVKLNAQREEDRPIRDGEILTACQQACPTAAIVFGDLNDKNSRVARLRAQPHNFGMLAELGTRPRTTYLAKLRNPVSEL